MKKALFIALAMLIAGTTAMAQPKTPQVKNTNQTTTFSVSKDGPKAPKADKKAAKSADKKAAKALDGKMIELPPAEMGLDAPLRLSLDKRRTVRDLAEEEIPQEMLSSLLWSAYGFNRPDELKRVVPSAVNAQEFDIYVFTKEGIFLYVAEKNALQMVSEGDHRAEISKQKHFAVAPVSIVMVANYDRMKMFKEEETRDFYAAVDAGYVSQDIYLFCAANGLGTVACGGIEREVIQKVIGFENGRAILAHPVGFAK